LKRNLENLKKSYEFSKKNPEVSKEQLSSIQRNIASARPTTSMMAICNSFGTSSAGDSLQKRNKEISGVVKIIND